MRLKIIDRVDSSFELDPTAQADLFNLLQAESFMQQVCRETGSEAVVFTKKLFQPVPYTTSTPKGMPAEFEKYHASTDFVIINVPPPFMFKAKIFKPSRLCAVYQKVSSSQ